MHDLINELDPNHDGKITQEEFILILSYIEQKQANLPPVGGNSFMNSMDSNTLPNVNA